MPPVTSALAVRAAVAGDLPAILSIYNHAVEYSTASYDLVPVTLEERQEWFALRQSGGWPVWVATVPDGEGTQDTILGFATYGPFRAKAGYTFTAEHSVYVTQGAQGQGIGSALLRELIAHARQRGLHALVGGIDAENFSSLRFHERLGFQPVAHFRQVGRKFGRWLDLVFVELLLDDMAEPPTPPGTDQLAR